MHGNYESVTVEHTDDRANERTNGQTKLFLNSVGEGLITNMNQVRLTTIVIINWSWQGKVNQISVSIYCQILQFKAVVESTVNLFVAYLHEEYMFFVSAPWSSALVTYIDWTSLPCSIQWRPHQMETFFALLSLCEGNSRVTGEFPPRRQMTRSFDVSFGLRLNKRLSKQSWGWWIETPSCWLWRRYNAPLWPRPELCCQKASCRHQHIVSLPWTLIRPHHD